MARRTTIDKLNDAIADILDEYADKIGDRVAEVTEAMGKKGVQAVRAQSKEKLQTHSGKYARGWKLKVDKARLNTTATIYNEHYSLPHLLEHGHVTRNGTGRVYPRTPAHEHIAPVAEELTESFQREVVDKL